MYFKKLLPIKPAAPVRSMVFLANPPSGVVFTTLKEENITQINTTFFNILNTCLVYISLLLLEHV
jgi:hypothetical protein